MNKMTMLSCRHLWILWKDSDSSLIKMTISSCRHQSIPAFGAFGSATIEKIAALKTNSIFLKYFFLGQYPIIPSSHEFLLVEYIFFLSYNFPCSRLCYETSTPTSQEPSSTIFQSLSVNLWGVIDTWPDLHLFFQYIKACRPYTGHVPSRINQYRHILTKY